MLLQVPPNYYEIGQGVSDIPSFGQWGTSYPANIGMPGDDSDGHFLGLEYADRLRLATNPLFSGYYDFGVRQITGRAGAYHYLSTRNNNFSNRSQKGLIVIDAFNNTEPYPIVENFYGRQTEISFAYLEYSPNERLQNQQIIRLEDAGASGYASNWVKVSPRILSIPDGGYLRLRMTYSWYPFCYGRIYWTEAIGQDEYEVFTVPDDWSWDGKGYNRANIMVGGYFVTKNVPNGSAIGGFGIALLGVIVLSVIAYRKFGCRCFNKSTEAAQPDQAREGLLPAGAASSSSAPASPAVETTTV